MVPWFHFGSRNLITPKMTLTRLLTQVDLSTLDEDISQLLKATPSGARNECTSRATDTTEPKSFRFQNRELCVTYSALTEGQIRQPIETAKELLDHLLTLKHNDVSVEQCIISKEKHENGEFHFHGYIKFTEKLVTRNSRFLDYKGIHPNIQAVRDRKKWITYITKDGEYVTHNITISKETIKKTKNHDAVWTQAIELAYDGKVKEAEDLIRTQTPGEWLFKRQQIVGCLQAERERGMAAKNPVRVVETNWIEEIENIDLTAKPEHDSDGFYAATHILVGSGGIGKTEAAKYLLKKHGITKFVLGRNIEAFKHISEYDAMIWDECNVNAQDRKGGPWSVEEQIQLVDRGHTSVLPCRYADIAVEPNVIRILTCNHLDRCLNMSSWPIERRVIVHNFGDKKLYKVNSN